MPPPCSTRTCALSRRDITSRSAASPQSLIVYLVYTNRSAAPGAPTTTLNSTRWSRDKNQINLKKKKENPRNVSRSKWSFASSEKIKKKNPQRKLLLGYSIRKEKRGWGSESGGPSATVLCVYLSPHSCGGYIVYNARVVEFAGGGGDMKEQVWRLAKGESIIWAGCSDVGQRATTTPSFTRTWCYWPEKPGSCVSLRGDSLLVSLHFSGPLLQVVKKKCYFDRVFSLVFKRARGLL